MDIEGSRGCGDVSGSRLLVSIRQVGVPYRPCIRQEAVKKDKVESKRARAHRNKAV
jgi:hypothetical protein